MSWLNKLHGEEHAASFFAEETPLLGSTGLAPIGSRSRRTSSNHRSSQPRHHPVAVLVASILLLASLVLLVVPVAVPMLMEVVAIGVPGVYYHEPPPPTIEGAAPSIPNMPATNETQQDVATNRDEQLQIDETATTTKDEQQQEQPPTATTTNAEGTANEANEPEDQDQVARPGVTIPVPVSPLVVPLSPSTSPPTAVTSDPDATASDAPESPTPATPAPADANTDDDDDDDDTSTATTTLPSESPTRAPTIDIAPILYSQETFGHLAQRLLPLYYSRMLASRYVFTPTVQPGQVAEARKTILKTRDLVDVFAPIYPNRVNVSHPVAASASELKSSKSFLADQDKAENQRYDHHHHHHVHDDKEMKDKHKELHHVHRHHHDHHGHGHRMRSSRRNENKDEEHGSKKHHQATSDTHDSSSTSESTSDTHTSGADETDPWWEFRHLLDNGYEKVGSFLDLDHSHAKYTKKMEEKERKTVLGWQEDFQRYAETHDVMGLFLSSPLGQYKHKKESHLFWGSTDETKRPRPDDPASATLRQLVAHQSKAASKYLDVSLGFQSVMKKEHHDEYHNLRKILRSIVDEFEMVGEIIDPYGRVSEEIAVLKQARSMLGHLNDDYVAWGIDGGDDSYRRKTRSLGETIHDQWLDFKKWATKKGSLEDSLKRLSQEMSKTRSPPTIRKFLQNIRRSPSHHLVIGNQAGDADSIISAITLAYIESIGTPTTKTPVVSTPRRSLERHRPEVKLLLKLAGVHTDSVLYADDHLMLQSDMSDYDVTLVDHNAIEAEFESKHWTVREILDHHKDENLYQKTCSGPNRTIAFAKGKPTVVSTCVLVFERMQHLLPLPYPAEVGLLLLGVILLDSANLATESRQISRRDEDSVRGLLMNVDWKELNKKTKRKLTMTKSARPDPTNIFNILQDARYDPVFWDSLSVNEALEYDFKEYSYSSGSFGVSTILMHIKGFLAKRHLKASILDFMDDLDTDFLAIMLNYESKGKHQRQLILCGRRHFPMSDLVDFLVKDRYAEQPLRLTEVNDGVSSSRHHGPDLTMRFFEQGNILSSRKQIGPILVEFFEDKYKD